MAYLLSSPAADDETITLPAAPDDGRRSPLPFAAAVVPLVGAAGMFAFTGSAFMLWFAALSPLMLAAGVLDRRRGRRSQRRAHAGELADAVADAERRIAARHAAERAVRTGVHPSVAQLWDEPGDIWRAHADREGTVTIGTGTVVMRWQVARGDDRDEARRLAAAARQLADAPVVVPLDGGICVRGPLVASRAVARSLFLQLCLLHPPTAWRTAAGGEEWTATLPHSAQTPRLPSPGAGTFRERTAVLADARLAVPAVDVPVVWCAQDAPVPPACRTVVDLADGLRGTVTRGGVTCEVTAEAVSLEQAAAAAAALSSLVASAAADAASDAVAALGDLPADGRGTLGAAVGVTGASAAYLDLVEDGPHAVVVGTTGSGKSELLITWAVSLCRAYPPTAVQLLLADFKGGTAFTPLAALPHVVGVLTDLDTGLAVRAVQSLGAEVRRREALIAGCGARDVADPRVSLPRLVVMIDEFPALLAQHPDLDPVFVDIAARGRALGIHLVLGAQRAVGSVRDATLANAPLRIALRTADAADSRAVIGTDDASAIAGGAPGRGLAYLRRAADAAPVLTRIALCAESDVAAAVRGAAEPGELHRPWLPPLPSRVEPVASVDGIVLGIADDPHRQTQPPVLLRPGERGLFAVGKAKSGKSVLARHVAGALRDAVWVPADPEAAWDALVRAAADPPTALVCDDVDVLLASWPEPWAGDAGARLESVVRRASLTGTTVVLTAQRLSGSVLRLADLLPRRAILAMPMRSDHLAAGGESATFVAARPPGRGVIDGLETQFVLPALPSASDGALQPPRWRPADVRAGVVVRASHDRIAALASAWGVPVLPVGETSGEPPSGAVLVGDPEQWQRSWAALEAVRRDGELVVASECAPEVRLLTGDRGVPPYAKPGRAWVFRTGRAPERVRWD